MLLTMQQSISAEAPSSTAAGFASLLSSLIAPTQNPAPAAKTDIDWNDDELADDFATLSYERAMHSHARYHASEFEDNSPVQTPMQASEPMPARMQDAFSDEESPLAQAMPKSAIDYTTKPEPKSESRKISQQERSLKKASITIRMSQAEYEQLHDRAAEAGLTVSAYLRSCTFEAESLRAQVKETLAQLRAGTALASQADKPMKKPPVAVKSSRFKWLSALKPSMPHFNSGQQPARV